MLDKNKIYFNLISFFFLLMFINSVFAFNVDITRLEENKTLYSTCSINLEEINNIDDFGSGCFTQELDSESVERLWDELLVSGFKVDLVGSDQKENTNRDTLEENDLLLTNKDTKANDVVLQQEMPNQEINPLEVPALLGQACYGPFSYGINLENTLRVGRCSGDENEPCYLEEVGLFRENGNNGFKDEFVSVGKDMLDMIGINKIKEEAGDIINPEADFEISEDMGIFSEMSYEQLEYIKSIQFDENATEFEMKKSQVLLENAIENSIKTQTFNASMETTCQGENCYINVYSLFDKMFNQYFSADLVVSSASPFLWKGATKIFGDIGNFSKNRLGFDISKKINAKKGGFIDNMLSEGDNPLKALTRSIEFKNASKNIDNYTSYLKTTQKEIRQVVDQYGIYDEYKAYTNALSSKKNIDTIAKEFSKGGKFDKLTKQQRRVLFESAQKYQDNLKMTQAIQESLIKNKDYDTAVKKLVEIIEDPNSKAGDIYKNLSSADYDIIMKQTTEVRNLTNRIDDLTESAVKWDKPLNENPIITSRKTLYKDPTTGKTELVMTNKVQPTTGASSSQITDIGGGNKAFEIKYNSDKGMYEMGAKTVKTETVDVTFSDGVTRKIQKIPVYREEINMAKGEYLERIDLSKYTNNPNIYIGYQDKSGIMKQVKATDFKLDDVDPSFANFKWYPVKETPLDAKDFGYDPIELAYSYVADGTKMVKDASIVNTSMMDVMNNKGWVSGKGINWINQQMKAPVNGKHTNQAMSLLGNSLNAYALNWAYWEWKTAGASLPFIGDSLSKYSAYQIPETYTSVLINHGEDGDIYKDAYIDYFVNDGSDQGDLFSKYFNSMLFYLVSLTKLGIESVDSKFTNSVDDWIKQITEGHIRRSTVDEVALFTDAENYGCNDNCYVKLGNSSLLEKQTYEKSALKEKILETQKENLEETDISIEEVSSQEPIKDMQIIYSIPGGITVPTYLLENTTEENLEDEGKTLITFSHHTDYGGSISGETDDKTVVLTDAKNNGDTCSQRIDELELIGVPIGWTTKWTGKSYRAGMVSAITSNLAYYAISAPSHRMILGVILGDLIPQTLITPQVQDCVDDEEGYYTHVFVSKNEEERIEKDPKNKIGDAISNGASAIQKNISNMADGTTLKENLSEAAKEVENFAETKIKDNPIVQSRFETIGNTSASVKGMLYFFELGEKSTCRASAYNDKGVEHLTDTSTNETLVIDKDEGKIEIVTEDGTIKNIIDSEHKDWVRLTATNLGIPAKVIPHSLSYIPVPDTNVPLFTMDAYGNITIENVGFLDCFKLNYESQTGLTMQGNSLTDYLGSAKILTTTNITNPTTQYDIMPKTSENNIEIVAEGVPRRSAKGNAAKVTVYGGERFTKMYPIDNQDVRVGQNIAIQFERGQMIYNGETNSYILWVEQTYTMHQSEIEDLDTKVVNYNNEVTGCEEFALDFDVKGKKDSADAQNKADEMNDALEHVGPFQIFDTATKTFIFYTGDPPECEKRMKIIDKETGQIITDQAIDEIIETPDGMIIKTADGKEHNFEFSAEDGVPRLQYNDELETLLSAQGKNGSFWYDPSTGNWYTENGHLIPFNPDFKDGMMFQVGEDGKVVGTTSQNPMNINIGGNSGSESSGFNIPLSPQSNLMLILYIFIIIGAFYIIQKKESYFKK
ncbi:MAG: hypothetical protein PHN22_03490 [Candidatus ainarchaeum sp.]|nr:hypothetical protein [Candidatus ainarchaeum sp.]